MELQGDEPEALADLWGRCTDLPVEHDAAGNPTIAFNNVVLRFTAVVDGRGPGLGGLDIAVANREHILREAKARNAYVSDDQVNICGTRWYLKDA